MSSSRSGGPGASSDSCANARDRSAGRALKRFIVTENVAVLEPNQSTHRKSGKIGAAKVAEWQDHAGHRGLRKALTHIPTH